MKYLPVNFQACLAHAKSNEIFATGCEFAKKTWRFFHIDQSIIWVDIHVKTASRVNQFASVVSGFGSGRWAMNFPHKQPGNHILQQKKWNTMKKGNNDAFLTCRKFVKWQHVPKTRQITTFLSHRNNLKTHYLTKVNSDIKYLSKVEQQKQLFWKYETKILCQSNSIGRRFLVRYNKCFGDLDIQTKLKTTFCIKRNKIKNEPVLQIFFCQTTTSQITMGSD